MNHTRLNVVAGDLESRIRIGEKEKQKEKKEKKEKRKKKRRRGDEGVENKFLEITWVCTY